MILFVKYFIIENFVSELLGITSMIIYSVNEYEHTGDIRRLSWGHGICDVGLAISLVGSILMASAQQSVSAVKAKAKCVGNYSRDEVSVAEMNSEFHNTELSPFTGLALNRHCKTNGKTKKVPAHVSGPFPSTAAIAAVNAAISPKAQRQQSCPDFESASLIHSKDENGESFVTVTSSCLKCVPNSPTMNHKTSSIQEHRIHSSLKNYAKHPSLLLGETRNGNHQVQHSVTWNEDMCNDGNVDINLPNAPQRQLEYREGAHYHHYTWSVTSNPLEKKQDCSEKQKSGPVNAYYSYINQHATTSKNNSQKTFLPPPNSSSLSNHDCMNFGYSRNKNDSDFSSLNATKFYTSLSHEDYNYRKNYYHDEKIHPEIVDLPDPSSCERSMLYEEERGTDTSSYHGYPNPIPPPDESPVFYHSMAIIPYYPKQIFGKTTLPNEPKVYHCNTDNYFGRLKNGHSHNMQPLVLSMKQDSKHVYEDKLHSYVHEQNKTFPRQQDIHDYFSVKNVLR